MERKGKHVNVRVNTTIKHLDFIGMSMEQVLEEIAFLMQTLGDKYFQILLGQNQTVTQFIFDDQLVDRAIYLSSIFRGISHLEGFKRHLKEYSKGSTNDHLFTARVAGWLVNQGYEVEMEPETSGKKPDLLIAKDGQSVSVECKCPNFTEFFAGETKRDIAARVFEKIQTNHQINVYFYEDPTSEEISELFDDEIISLICELDIPERELRFCISPKIEIAIIPIPEEDDIGAGEITSGIIRLTKDSLHVTGTYFDNSSTMFEDGFLNAEIVGINVDTETGVRLPSFNFLSGKRGIRICGPRPDYESRLKDYRNKSKKQGLPNLPMICILNGDQVMGDPELHKSYIQDRWLNKHYSQCSGVGILHFNTTDQQPILEYFSNPEATYSYQPNPSRTAQVYVNPDKMQIKVKKGQK